MPRLELVLMLLAGIVIGGLAGAVGTMKYLDFASAAASEAFMLEAALASKRGDVASVETFAYDVIGANPQHHDGYLVLAEVMEKRGQMEATLSLLERALLCVKARSGNWTGLVTADTEISWQAQQIVIERKIAALSIKEQLSVERVATPH